MSFIVPNQDTFESESVVVLVILRGISHKLEQLQGKLQTGTRLGSLIGFTI